MSQQPTTTKVATDPGADARAGSGRAGIRELIPVVLSYVVPGAIVLFLAFNGGGYHVVPRGELGAVIWGLVFAGCLVGVLPAVSPGRRTIAGIALLAAIVAWTALGTIWTESVEQTVIEIGRTLTFLGVFVLTALTQDGSGLRRVAVGVGAAIAVVSTMALLSRLHPQWFGVDETAAILEDAKARLNYPLDYWNALAALTALGLPLVIWMATTARFAVARGLAAAAVPAMTLTAYYTLSRGGAIEIAFALLVLVACHPRRITQLGPTLAVAGAGSGLALALALQRDALAEGTDTALARSQGDDMLLATVLICAAVGVAQAVIAAFWNPPEPRRLPISRRTRVAAVGGLAVVVLGVLVAAGAPGKVSDAWDRFKEPEVVENADVARLSSGSGNGRYQVWEASLDAFSSEPATGIGPGTFEFWWARHASIEGFVRNAHSLFLETLGEQGVIGLILVVALFALVIWAAVSGCLRGPTSDRELFAAVAAAMAAFTVAAAIDWVWQVAVVPVAFLILAAATLAARDGVVAPPRRLRQPSLIQLGLAVLAVGAIGAIAVPVAGTLYVEASQESARNGDLDEALSRAETAADLEPYAASPLFQQAGVLELQGDFESAAEISKQATDKEPTNWRMWVQLSRLLARSGDAEGALEAFRTAKSLNPLSDTIRAAEGQ